jgi:peptidoglycan/LPS O-acetylase OafA/YrhL
VAALDGVRALAVAAVLLYHGGVAWLPGGFLGVDVFFVLSGFLITSLLLAELRGTGRIDLLRFWGRRARRLLPAAFLVIGVCVVVAAIFLPADFARTRTDALASFAYVNNWHQLLADRSYFAGFARPSLLQHLWSLAVEEQFYLLWPLALGALLGRLGRRGAVLVTIVAALASALAMTLLFTPGEDPSRVYFGTDTHASGLLVGALLAFAWPLGGAVAEPRPGARRVLDGAALGGLAAVLLAMATWQDYDPLVYRGGIFAVAVATAILVAAVVHPASRVGVALGRQPLRWIGQRSYGIYLWHWPVMALSRPGADLAWNHTLLLGLQIALTVALAAASYRWLEEPIRSRRAQRALKGWLDRRPPRGRLAFALGTLGALVAAVSLVAVRPVPAPATPPVAVTHSAVALAAPSRVVAAQPAAAPAATGPALAVGASVMLSAQAALGRHATVDAAVGRQIKDIVARLESYRAARRLPERVVVQVGENGPLYSDDLGALRSALRGVRRVVLVNVRVTRRWNADTNQRLAELAGSWPQARVADWYDASAGPGLLYGDGTHPTPRGRRVYARVVERALRG